MTAAELQNKPQPEHDLIAGRYRLAERIGQGRLGDIFHAVDEKRPRVSVEQRFALQIVSDAVGRSNSLFNKLKIGYQSLRAASHPNIVKYRTFDRDGSEVYLVMEHLEGAPLSELLDDAVSIPLDEVLPVLRGVGDALQFLHAEGLVHGNLTARNVFITDKLDARLLDVVPLAAAEAIFPGATASQSSGRSSEADDVFALACLAYQMLSGRHPFNHSNPARTGQAGREPDRIESLSGHEWNAMRRALMLHGEQTAYSIADFLRDFGVRGNEHLRSATTSPVVAEPAASPMPVVESPPMIPREPATLEVAELRQRAMRADSKPDAPKASPWRAVSLTLLAAVLGAWAYLGQPQERIAELLAQLDSGTNSEITGDFPVVTAPPDVEQTEVDQTIDEPLEMLQPLPEDDIVAVMPDPSAEPETAETPLVGPPAEPVAEAAAGAETDAAEVVGPPAETVAEPAPEPVAEEPAATEPEVGVTEAVVSVSERGVLAKVKVTSDTELNGPLVWWTSDGSARADSDYVAVPEQFLDVAYGGTLSIPLVNDNLPEQRESFYVDVGVKQPEGQIERIASIRVDIVDDDLH